MLVTSSLFLSILLKGPEKKFERQQKIYEIIKRAKDDSELVAMLMVRTLILLYAKIILVKRNPKQYRVVTFLNVLIMPNYLRREWALVFSFEWTLSYWTRAKFGFIRNRLYRGANIAETSLKNGRFRLKVSKLRLNNLLLRNRKKNSLDHWIQLNINVFILFPRQNRKF